MNVDKKQVLQIGPYPEWDEVILNELFTMHRYFEIEDKNAFLRENGSNIHAIATRGELGADRALIESLPSLEIISVYGVGFDAVDLEAATEKGVRVSNTPDVLTKDVADFGLAMMLAASRQVIQAEQWVRSGDWVTKGGFPLSTRVHGKKAGILGLGRIGFEVAKRLAGFDMQIAYCDTEKKDYAADWAYINSAVELARESDFLFVTLAASVETRHIVNQAVLQALGSDGMVINISRAANIDEQALLNALENRTIGFAALDVFEGEPEIDPRFLELDNVLLQPHQASGTVETRKAMGQLVRDNLLAHFSGAPLPSAVI